MREAVARGLAWLSARQHCACTVVEMVRVAMPAGHDNTVRQNAIFSFLKQRMLLECYC